MIELVIHGRGGRGGVTLAKLIAGAYFARGKHAQAFGVYGAERTGAPVQAYVRADDEEITIHNAIAAPDHVVFLEPSLVAPSLTAAMSDEGWVIINTPQTLKDVATAFRGRGVAVVNADAIAVAHRLGTKALPIVNSSILGAVGRVLDLEFDDVAASLESSGFAGANTEAAKVAFEEVVFARQPGKVQTTAATLPGPIMGILDDGVGTPPTTRTGSWASRRPHARELVPVCSDACPAGNDVRGFVQAAAAGDYDAALAVLLESSPFPGVCGRVCPAPCGGTCNRRALDAAVDVRGIERAIAERGTYPAPVTPFRDQRVAIVGAGPAGLSAAYHLVRRGYPVTVFEAGAELGGLLRTGIPAYRLPRDVLDREVGFIVDHGVDVRAGQYVDRTRLTAIAGDYAAVLVTSGQQRWRSLELEARRTCAVGQGLEFLDAVQRCDVADISGESVVVAGGGSTAIDAARTALRLGASDVRIAYRRTRCEMPAIAEEIDEALEEGIVLEELTMPVHLRANGERATLVCRRLRLGAPDETGRPRPIPIQGDDGLVEMRCDRLLFAIGQDGDPSILPDVDTAAEGPLHCDGASAPVFLAGDFATSEGTVAAAIGSGRRAALAIDATLCDALVGERPLTAPGVHADHLTVGEESASRAGLDVVHLHAFPLSAPRPSAMVEAVVRRTSFVEVRQGFAEQADDDPARAEAGRCFSCGACNGCDACITCCPEGVLARLDDQTLAFDYDYCKGCGLCATQCPRGAVAIVAV